MKAIYSFLLLLFVPAAYSGSIALTDEEANLAAAPANLTEVTQRYNGLITESLKRYQASNDELKSAEQAKHEGEKLWVQAVTDAQAGAIDDRALYWQRLNFHVKAKQSPLPKLADWQKIINHKAYERASRGFSNITWREDTDIAILVMGFDPYNLIASPDNSNPSGVAALSLDGASWLHNDKRYEIQSVIFPVRFKDFDDGLVESAIASVSHNPKLKAIFTLSMGREHFDLERFVSVYRSSIAPDNNMIVTGASLSNPMLPFLLNKPLQGDAVLEFNLPVRQMMKAQGPYNINDNGTVTTESLSQQTFTSLKEIADTRVVAASAGGYLSNEISYRTIRYLNINRPDVTSGHIHMPRQTGHQPEQLADMLSQLNQMLRLASYEL